MTIDEQIKILESNAEYIRKEGDLQGYLNFRQLAEWLKDYKRLLEQQPCEDCCNGIQTEKAKLCQKSYLAGMEHGTCEDAVSRQAVIKELDWAWAKGIFNPKSLIVNLPPVNPQPKIGHWIEEQ